MSLRAKRRSQAAAVAAEPARVSVEVPSGVDPDHHLWKNGRLWWIAFTVHRGHLQERVRLSLATDDLLLARERRDELLALFAQAAELRISLRFAPPRSARALAAGAREVA